MNEPRVEENGTSLVELLVAMGVFLILGAAMSQVTTIMVAVQQQNDTRTSLHAHAMRGMRQIISDLEQSAFQNVAGKDFPYVFDGGVAVAPFASHAHPPAASASAPGDPDFGVDREIVFVLPADADQDGRPDYAGTQVVWSTDEVSYTVVTGSAGNALVRSVNAANPEIVARHIERMVFDTPTSSGFTIPLGTVRVRLFLRTEDRHGTVYRHQTETTIRLQFGNL